ncbi:hypothetical protein MBLNU230_g4435t1 [Neophaeotheca triangularis]
MAGYTESGVDLAAVLLITRSRPGPKLVYHYAGHSDKRSGQQACDDASDTTSDIASTREGRPASETPPGISRGFSSGPSKPNTVLGLDVDMLERLLSPGKWCDRKKFEIKVDGWTFIGHPVYAYENGSWNQNAVNHPSKQDPTEENEYYDYLPYETGEKANVPESAPQAAGYQSSRFQHLPDSLEAGYNLGTSYESTSTSSDVAPEALFMFHVVFVMTGGEANSRLTDLIYRDVAKTLGEALRYCQKQSNYVARQVRRMLSARTCQSTDNDASTPALHDSSELAWALKETYDKIDLGKTAGIRLGGYELSIQSSAISTTATAGPDATTTIGSDAALLLLEAKEVMLSELSHADAGPLAYFVREQTPTKSLQKHANSLGLPIHDVLYMARHLVKWRKARAVAPLHPRNTYVCNPEKALSEIDRHATVFAQQFAALPALPSLLKMISSKPVQFGHLIPSRDHRAAYMEMLAYLVRHDFVRQLKTFAWLRLSQHLLLNAQPLGLQHGSPETGSARLASLPSSGGQIDEDETSSQVSNRTAVPWSQSHAPYASASKNERSSDASGVVQDPMRMTEKEAGAVAVLLEQLPEAAWQENFPAMLAYLDGSHALEEIAAKEGLKRSIVENCLGHLERGGFLMTMRA